MYRPHDIEQVRWTKMHEKLIQQIFFWLLCSSTILYIILHQNLAEQKALKINPKTSNDGWRSIYPFQNI